MLTPELLDFIRQQLALGLTREELSAMLLSEGGWDKADVDEAFRAVDPPAPTQPAPTPFVAQLNLGVQGKTHPVSQSVIQPNQAESAMRAMDEALAAKNSPLISLMRAEEERSKNITPPIVVVPDIEAVVVPAPNLKEKDIFKAESVESVKEPEDVPSSAVNSRTEHYTPPSVLPGEDFLGIFDVPEVGKSQKESPISPRPLDGVPGKNVEIRVLNVKKPEAQVSPPSTPTSAPKIENLVAQTNSFSALLTPTTKIESEKGTPVVAQPAVSRFNLEKMRSADAEDLSKKTIEAASLGTTERPPMITMQPSVDSVEHSGTQHTASFGRRTMASDILLHGLGAASTSNAPSAPPTPPAPPEALMVARPTVSPPVLPTLSEAQKEVAPHPELALPTHESLANDIMKKNRTKRVLGVVIGAILVLTALGGVGYAISQFVSDTSEDVLSAALINFYTATSLGYDFNGKIDFVVSDNKKIERQPSSVKISLASKGTQKNGVEGFGDGIHDITLSSSIESGDFALPTELEADILMQGASLFFRLRSFPETSDLDPALFEKYWIKVNLTEVAQELALSGVLAAGGEYGGFVGSGGGESNFLSLIKKHNPLIAEKTIEEGNESAQHHLSFRLSPDGALEFVLATYRKYMGKELVLSDDQRIRLKNAVEKFEGELWVDKESMALAHFVLRANLDDVIVDMVVKGNVNIEVALSDMNKPVEVTTPGPVLTLEELRVEMEKFISQKEVRAKDQEKIDRMELVINALTAHFDLKKKFPASLRDLYSSNLLAESVVTKERIEDYFYAAYVGKSFNKPVRCKFSDKLCGSYHIGVNLESGDSKFFAEDADETTDIRGADDRGCSGEKEVGCYDITSFTPLIKPKTETVPPPPSPSTDGKAGNQSATLELRSSVSGKPSENLTIKAGENIYSTWTTTGADSARMSIDVTGCKNESANGSASLQKDPKGETSQMPTDASQSGCILKISITAMSAATGEKSEVVGTVTIL